MPDTVLIMTMLRLLFWRRAISHKNSLLHAGRWEKAKKVFFVLVTVGVLIGVYSGLYRLLKHLESALMIGPLLTWKLTAMVLLTTFSMVALSGFITAVGTLYYSEDLGLLRSSPLPPRLIFLDKMLETTFHASWMVALAVIPYLIALGKVKSLSLSFYLMSFFSLIPFLALAAALGILLTLGLMTLFPSPRTRDAVWILSSLSIAVVYVVFRLSQPEKLVRPDALEKISQYLDYLQAPTAPYLPSWWLTQSWMAASTHHIPLWIRQNLMLAGATAFLYIAGLGASQRMYPVGLSGAMDSKRLQKKWPMERFLEERFLKLFKIPLESATLLWKDRKVFFRDVKYWSQFLLILALVVVYLFSIWKLPLDTPDLKSMMAFFNIGTTGFIIAALCLRFVFPSISLEGKSFWFIKSAPVSLSLLMWEKFFFTAFPLLILSALLVHGSNLLLQADPFVSRISLGTILLCTVSLCAMGVGLGALFPRFHVDNIHQIESSAGGFAYMACAMGYLFLTLAIEALPLQMHFYERFGKVNPWQTRPVAYCLLALAALNAAAFVIPWKLGQRALERHDV